MGEESAVFAGDDYAARSTAEARVELGRVILAVEAAIEAAQHSRASELVVSGGAQIYTAALDYADSLVLTLVDTDVEGSAQFPEFSPSENWCCSETEWYAADVENAYAMEIQRWERH